MKICPSCGLLAVDTAVVCDVDGTPLETAATATTLPVRRTSGTWCLSCGSRDGDGGSGTCIRCGNRYGRPKSLPPGAPGSRLLDLVLVREHGEGDVVVLDSVGGGGGTRLLVFGTAAAVVAEASALRAPAVTLVPGHAMFPTVVREGRALEVGQFALLSFAVEGGRPATPLLEATLSFDEGVSLVRQALDAAAQLEARGYAWEPWPTDLYLRDGELVVVRARGARKLREGEPLDAKRVLEALAGALLPEPFSRSTPTMVRLLLPRWNFSSPEMRTIQEARADLAEVVSLAHPTEGSEAAALSDPGLRRAHHEDATALTLGEAGGERFAILVVCDGVSSSTHADAASRIAAAVSRDSLAQFARQGLSTATPDEVSRAMTRAIREGHVAICTAGIEHGAGPPPATTIVTALVYRRKLTVGWVGDSRAYWVSPLGSRLCTSDHSWLNDMVGRGVLTESEALTSPFAHALTRCLGPVQGDGGGADSTPDVRTLDLVGNGRLILCTDGLWNYFPSAEAIAALVAEAPLPGELAHADALARFLVCRALAEGGGDNVSVVVLELDVRA